MPDRALQPTSCALCGAAAETRELYAERLDATAFSTRTFSARRRPDRMHYRIVRCETCGLVRSDPTASGDVLGQLYAESSFTYGRELEPLRRTYGRYLRLLERYEVRKGDLLEVGCGNGFFLDEALDQGYATVRGVEPSQDAIDCASARIQPFLTRAILRPGLFEAASFDVVCLFQVLDHIPDPCVFLAECYRLLRPGGLLLAINHNVLSLSARVLRERSPIFDVEHTYLYGPATMAAIARRANFDPRVVRRVVNTCSIGYLLWLLPLPGGLKRPLTRLADGLGLSRVAISLPLGNLVFVGRKDASR